MQKSEEENHDLPQKSKPLDENVFSMDYDIDFETSWPLDHISNSMHPFFLQNISEQPFSPIWTFSDDDHNIAASGYSSLSCYVCVFGLFQLGFELLFNFLDLLDV